MPPLKPALQETQGWPICGRQEADDYGVAPLILLMTNLPLTLSKVTVELWVLLQVFVFCRAFALKE